MKIIAQKAGRVDEELAGCQSIDIMADDGRALYHLSLTEDGAIEISLGGMVVKHKGVMLDNKIKINPGSSGSIWVEREPYHK